ncbi:plasmid related protein [Ralstonia solanacearum]|nr:plasmid related protein [Ralstonia solanacearum]NKF94167.1 plasmid related protein [Ralstonia solanacearum]NKG09522.1 plasmid related protein [Ralstonia solanacearum]
MTEPSVPKLPQPRLPLGHLLATPAAVAVLATADVSIFKLLNRHARGDWGDLSDEDRQQNDQAAVTAQRVLSSYLLGNGRKVWIITEADRAMTTVLLPEDY